MEDRGVWLLKWCWWWLTGPDLSTFSHVYCGGISVIFSNIYGFFPISIFFSRFPTYSDSSFEFLSFVSLKRKKWGKRKSEWGSSRSKRAEAWWLPSGQFLNLPDFYPKSTSNNKGQVIIHGHGQDQKTDSEGQNLKIENFYFSNFFFDFSKIFMGTKNDGQTLGKNQFEIFYGLYR